MQRYAWMCGLPDWTLDWTELPFVVCVRVPTWRHRSIARWRWKRERAKTKEGNRRLGCWALAVPGCTCLFAREFLGARVCDGSVIM